jgi:hypothetical protein
MAHMIRPDNPDQLDVTTPPEIPHDQLPAESHPYADQIVRLGHYQHFKGGLYTLVNVGRHHHDRDQLWAVYMEPDGGVTVRPLAEFLGTHESGSKRFTYVGDRK